MNHLHRILHRMLYRMLYRLHRMPCTACTALYTGSGAGCTASGMYRAVGRLGPRLMKLPGWGGGTRAQPPQLIFWTTRSKSMLRQ
jgi:hypothetical protein